MMYRITKKEAKEMLRTRAWNDFETDTMEWILSDGFFYDDVLDVLTYNVRDYYQVKILFMRGIRIHKGFGRHDCWVVDSIFDELEGDEYFENMIGEIYD